MKRVHDWEEPDNSGFDSQDRPEPNKRRKSGHSNSVQMKRSSSNQAKTQGASYSHGSRHGASMIRYAAQAEKHLHSDMVAYPLAFNEVQYAQMNPYQQQPRTSDAYSNTYLVAY